MNTLFVQNCSDIVGGNCKAKIAKLHKEIIGAMEELMEHMQKHQRQLSDALATSNYCQVV
jgi:UDP-N-acetylglucosamine transferase subunit ALG13